MRLVRITIDGALISALFLLLLLLGLPAIVVYGFVAS